MHSLSHASLSSGPAATPVSVFSTAYFTVNDLVFSATSSPVNTQLNLSLAGLLNAAGDNGASSATSNVTVSFELSDQNQVYGNESTTFLSDGEQFGFGAGATLDPSHPAILTSDAFPVPTNVPLSLTVELHTEATIFPSSSGDPFAGPADADADFSHTLTFATDRPVFNNYNDVPGFTVNSVSGGIVLNTAVPEPMGASALIGIALFSLRRTRRN